MPVTLTNPQPLADAVAQISAKTPIGSVLRSAELERMPLALRETAQFSSGVESARLMAAIQSRLLSLIKMERDATSQYGPADQPGAYRIDRQKFVAEIQALALDLGLKPTDPSLQGGLQDITSSRRIRLILDTQIERAQGHAWWKSGQDPELLQDYPAQELVRDRASRVPRDWRRRWADAGGRFFDGRMIALKTDPIWIRISRFGTPWPPYDFNSGMGIEDIDREEAEELGLIAPGDRLDPIDQDFNDGMQASVRGLPEPFRQALKNLFGDQMRLAGDVVEWVGSAPFQGAREGIPARAVSRPGPAPGRAGSPPDAPRMGALPNPENPLDSGRNPTEPQPGAVDALPTDRSQTMEPGDRDARALRTDARVIGAHAARDFRAVFPGWEGPFVRGHGEAARGSEARAEGAIQVASTGQVAAAALGRKPLYFDPWSPAQSAALAMRLRRTLPRGTVVHVDESSGLYVFRPEAVRPILDADPAFYRPQGESDIEAIVRASLAGENGDLLGYGARNWAVPQGAKVTILDRAETLFVFFVSDPDRAEFWAAERLRDIIDYRPDLALRYEIERVVP